MMNITTVIFDIGNVLVDFCWEKFFRQFCDSEEMFKRLTKATVLDDAWNQFDKGDLSEKELRDLFVSNAPDLASTIDRMMADVNGMVEEYPYAKEWITSLKSAGYRVLILSNFSEKAYRECANQLEFVKLADGAVISYQEKLIKPDKEIYRRLLERYHVSPDECVFIDDKKENIRTALDLGMKGIVFSSKEEAVAGLEELGVCV